jgi:alpha-ketoglutarate-dependent 2,4-dichlorophenoxyacetate dioxygenase
VAPIGGNTEFTDLRAAYDALQPALQAKLEGLVAEHSILNSRRRLGVTDFSEVEREAFAPVHRPLVRTIPESGRKSLYIASHIGRIAGLSMEVASALLEELTAHATQRQFVYAHRWRIHDLVVWDNRCTMHRGTEYDDLRWPRDLQRVTTSDRLDAFGVSESAPVAVSDY